jgi:signal peptidase complex subunit 2
MPSHNQSRLSTAPPPPTRPVLYEAITYKRILDDTLHSYVEAPASLEEDLSYHNFKIVIMALSSISALIAQFYPIPFPGNRLILLVCVVVYFALSGVYQFLVTFIDRDSISTFKTKTKGEKKEVVLRSTLHKYSDEYTAILECPSGKEVAKFTRSIGNYFTKDGEYAESLFKRDVEKFLMPAITSLGGDKNGATIAEKKTDEEKKEIKDNKVAGEKKGNKHSQS